jgi:hypothetical protein
MTPYLPAWMPIQAVWFFVAGLGGLLAHYVSARARGEINSNLFVYLFVDHPGWTIATVLSLVAADFAAVATLGLEELKLSTVVASGFTSGWAIDSGVSPRRHDEDCDH